MTTVTSHLAKPNYAPLTAVTASNPIDAACDRLFSALSTADVSVGALETRLKKVLSVPMPPAASDSGISAPPSNCELEDRLQELHVRVGALNAAVTQLLDRLQL